MSTRHASFALTLAFLVSFSPSLLTAQDQPQPPLTPDAMVRLNFPQEIEVGNLVDYVSQRLGIKLLYDEQVANKKITVKAPTELLARSFGKRP
jgi:hypothetical protein